MAHSPCALSKAGGRPGGLLLLGQEGSEVACRGSCWPATATILSSAPLLPTRQTHLRLQPRSLSPPARVRGPCIPANLPTWAYGTLLPLSC